jgi:RTX calcium-binding nonapeptide repeat (4 copies)
MRRLILLLAMMAATLVVASGVALAVNKIGTNGSDTLKGTNGADTLIAKGGNDVLYALGGRDTLVGEEGKDWVLGGNEQRPLGGNKSLVGGPGNDGVLKRLSQWLGCSVVAAMLEEAPSVVCRYPIQRPTHRFQQGFSGARSSPAQQRLYLGECFFYGIEIGRVGRQVHQLAPPSFDELAHPRSLCERRGCPSPLLPALDKARVPTLAPGKLRRPLRSLGLRPPGTAPSLSRSCSLRA